MLRCECESVNLNRIFQQNHNSISSQSHSFHIGRKFQFDYMFFLQIVPNHHLVRRVPRIVSASDQGQVIATEQHFHESDASVLEICLQME